MKNSLYPAPTVHENTRLLWNAEAEQGILGALLVNPNGYDLISDMLYPEHFYAPAHQRIFTAIRDELVAGRKPSAVTLKLQFDDDPELETQGGGRYLTDLMAACVSTYNTKSYAETIIDLWKRREIFRITADAAARASDHDQVDEILDDIENSAYSLRIKQEGSETVSAREAYHDALIWIENIRSGKIKPTLCHIKPMDRVLKGFFAGGVYVLAGRPAMGKTALGLNILQNIADNTTGQTLMFSMEMQSAELTMRLASRQTAISISDQRDATTLTIESMRRLTTVQVSPNIFIDDSSSLTIEQIILRSKRFCRQNPNCQAILIDHLHRMKLDDRLSTVQAYSKITAGLKDLAKSLNVPVIVLSQLSRAVEGREEPKPKLSDLRDSGSIEQDADVVMFIYREEYYLEKSKPVQKANEDDGKYYGRIVKWELQLENSRGKAQVSIQKNRQGRCTDIEMYFDGVRQLFTEDAPQGSML